MKFFENDKMLFGSSKIAPLHLDHKGYLTIGYGLCVDVWGRSAEWIINDVCYPLTLKDLKNGKV